MATVTIAAVAWMVGAGVALAPDASSLTESRALTRAGYRQAYELKFDESLALFADARRADPSDPAPPRAIAAVTWMEILFAQGVATYTAFQGSPSADTVVRPAIPPHLAARFSEQIAVALRLAQQRATASVEDLDAQYQLGATWGLQALYRGTVEGRTMAAFMDGRRAVAIMMRIRKDSPDSAEAALIPGIYRYAVSTLPWHKRLIATAAGLPPDKEGGIKLLEVAASERADTSTDALLVLMTIYNREGRRAEAMTCLRHLVTRHPGNRLLRLNLAMTALDARDHAHAATIAADPPKADELGRPRVVAERALWSYVRGAGRAAQGDARGMDDLEHASQEETRDWIRARAHLELGKFALRAGDAGRGSAELEAALHFGRRAGDDVAVQSAQRLLKMKGDNR